MTVWPPFEVELEIKKLKVKGIDWPPFEVGLKFKGYKMHKETSIAKGLPKY